jgi:hypothetical protein
MQQQLSSSSIPRRSRGAVASMLDDALESGERKPNRPAKPPLIWSLLLAGGLIFYWVCVRDGAMFQSDAGWFLMISAGGFLFAADRNFDNRAWWAFMPWFAALLLEIRLESAAELTIQRSTATFLFQYAAAASEFLIFVLLWVVFLPGVRRPDHISSSLWRNSQAVLLLIGCVVGSFQAHELLKLLHTSTMPLTEQIHWVEGWFSRSTFIIYGFVACRAGLFQSIYSTFARSNTDRLPARPL